MKTKTYWFGATQFTHAQIELALAACRSIKFATEQAARHGSYSLNDLLAADRLARAALGDQEAVEEVTPPKPSGRADRKSPPSR